MSNLEEQLRKSREKERPDLQPPAGGWEAIQASLAATAAGAGTAVAAAEATAAGQAASGGAMGAAGTAAGTAAATGAKASLLATSLKALLGLCVVGGLATGAWMALGDDPLPVEMVGVEAIAAETTPAEKAPAGETTEPIASGEAVPVNPQAREEQQAELPVTSTVASTSAAGADAGRTATPPAVPTSVPASTSVAAEQRQPVTTKSANSSVVITPAPENSPAGTSAAVSEETAAANPGAPPTPTATAPVAETPVFVDNTVIPAENAVVDASASEAEQLINRSEAEIPTPGFTEVALPLASRQGQRIEPITAAPLREVVRTNTVFTGFESLAFYGQEGKGLADDGRFRKFKRPARSSWQLHGGMSGLASNRFSGFGSNVVLERTTGPGALQVTLPSGELVNANFTGAFSSSVARVDNFMFRVGATRQTSWGGAFRGTLGYYSGKESQTQDFGQLAPNQLALGSERSSRAATLELGFQYTFLRRHKFRPYLGMNSVFFFGASSENNQVVFDNQTSQQAVVSTFDGSSPFAFWQGVSLTAGFQYQLAPRWSAGVFLWTHGSNELWLEAPVGFEVRYLLK